MIKFRVWDENKKTYLTKHQTFDFISLDENFVYTLEPYKESQIIEQFTGLQDKNGKEIFVGDILYLKEVNKSGNVIVGLEKGAFIVFKGLAYRNLGIYEPYNIEVIGNINENKELLKSFRFKRSKTL